MNHSLRISICNRTFIIVCLSLAMMSAKGQFFTNNPSCFPTNSSANNIIKSFSIGSSLCAPTNSCGSITSVIGNPYQLDVSNIGNDTGVANPNIPMVSITRKNADKGVGLMLRGPLTNANLWVDNWMLGERVNANDFEIMNMMTNQVGGCPNVVPSLMHPHNSVALHINSSNNNVGVGTISPNAQLHVVSSPGSNSFAIQRMENGNQNNYLGIELTSNPTGTLEQHTLTPGSAGIVLNNDASNSAGMGYMVLSTKGYNLAAATEGRNDILIDDKGRVGIGDGFYNHMTVFRKYLPAAQLHVKPLNSKDAIRIDPYVAPNNGNSATGELQFRTLGNLANDAHQAFTYVGFKAPAATVPANSSTIWVLPPNDGAANQVLSTDGAKNLVWQSIATNNTNVTINCPGTVNQLPKWTSVNQLCNSLIYDNGTGVGINNANPVNRFEVTGNASIGYPSIAAPANGLMVNGQTMIGTTSPSFCGQSFKFRVADNSSNLMNLERTDAPFQNSLSFIMSNQPFGNTISKTFLHSSSSAVIALNNENNTANDLGFSTHGSCINNTNACSSIDMVINYQGNVGIGIPELDNLNTNNQGTNNSNAGNKLAVGGEIQSGSAFANLPCSANLGAVDGAISLWTHGGGGHKIKFIPNNNMTADNTYTLPAGYGTNGQVLTTDSLGRLSWAPGGNIVTNNLNCSIGGIANQLTKWVSQTEICNSVITDDGNNHVGIGTVNPINAFDVKGKTVIGFGFAGVYLAAADSNVIHVPDLLVAGGVGIGTAFPGQSGSMLEVRGEIQAGTPNNPNCGCDGGAEGALSMYSLSSNKKVIFHPNPNMTSQNDYILPPNTGGGAIHDGYVLKTNGQGALRWESETSGNLGLVSSCSSGTINNRAAKFDGNGNEICNSVMYDNGTNIGIDGGCAFDNYFSNSNNPLDKLQLAGGNFRLGEVIGVPTQPPYGPCANTDYGRFLIFSGGSPLAGSSDNLDPLWISRFNYQATEAGVGDRSQLRVNIGDDAADANNSHDLFSVGTTLPEASISNYHWVQHMCVASNGNVGIGRSLDTALTSGYLADFTNDDVALPYRRLEILDNRNSPQFRITQKKSSIPGSSTYTDFQTTAQGNLLINTSTFDGMYTYGGKVGINFVYPMQPSQTLDINGSLRITSYPGAMQSILVNDGNGVVGHTCPGCLPYVDVASNGLHLEGSGPFNLYLGQQFCKMGDPGKLLFSTEVPMDNNNFIFSPGALSSTNPTLQKFQNDVGIGMTCTQTPLHARLDVLNTTEDYAAQFVTNIPNSNLNNNGVRIECSGANASADNVGMISEIPANYAANQNNITYRSNISAPSNSNNIGFDCNISGTSAQSNYGIKTFINGASQNNYGIYGSVGSSATNNIGIYGESISATSGNNTGIKGIAQGSAANNIGADVSANGNNSNVGIEANANTGTNSNIAIDATSASTSSNASNIGIKSTVSGGGITNHGIDITASYTGSNDNYGGYINAINTGGSASTQHNYGIYVNAICPQCIQPPPVGLFTGIPGNNWAGFFNGTVYSSGGYYYASDAKLKKDKKPIEGAMDIINKLKPQTYSFKNDEYPYLNLPAVKQYGLIAQEVETVVPEAVTMAHHPEEKSADGAVSPALDYKSVNYDLFIPILIQGLKEEGAKIDTRDEKIKALEAQVETQNTKMDELQKQVTQLAAMINNCCSAIEQNQVPKLNVNTEMATLEQNMPNPFNENTIIKYFIPNSAKTSKIIIQTLDGKTLNTFRIDQAGAGKIMISGGMLAPGTYFYQLVMDDRTVDTKRMVLLK